MSQGQKTRIMILALLSLVVLALMVFSILPDSVVHRLSSPFSFLLRPIEFLITGGEQSYADYLQNIQSNRKLREENERLRKENLALRLSVRDKEKAAEAYQDFKQAFSLKDRFLLHDFVAVNIIERPHQSLQRQYRLDAGSREGIVLGEAAGYPVINENLAVAGQIFRSDRYASTLLPLTHEGFSVSAKGAKDQEAFFRVRGDVTLQASHRLVADQIPESSGIQVGDKLLTTGRGGIFPEGLWLGTIEKLGPVDALGERAAVVKPGISLEQSRLLFVMIPMKEAEILQEDEVAK